jgi:hypothetical protein
MALSVERKPWLRAGIGRTEFLKKRVLKDSADPFVPNTDGKVRRIRSVPLGDKARGFFSDEVDGQLEEYRTLRDAMPVTPPKLPLPPQYHSSVHRRKKPKKPKPNAKPKSTTRHVALDQTPQ